MKNDIAYTLVSEEEIDSIVTRIAAEIDRDYSDRSKGLLLLCRFGLCIPLSCLCCIYFHWSHFLDQSHDRSGK